MSSRGSWALHEQAAGTGQRSLVLSLQAAAVECSDIHPVAHLDLLLVLLVGGLTMFSNMLHTKQLQVGECCTAPRCATVWDGVGCGVGLGAAPVSPSTWGPAEDGEEGNARDEGSQRSRVVHGPGTESHAKG